MRYRLIPSRGRSAWRSRDIEASSDVAAANVAEGWSEEISMQVLLCRVAKDGTVASLGLCGEDPEPKKRGKR